MSDHDDSLLLASLNQIECSQNSVSKVKTQSSKKSSQCENQAPKDLLKPSQKKISRGIKSPLRSPHGSNRQPFAELSPNVSTSSSSSSSFTYSSTLSCTLDSQYKEPSPTLNKRARFLEECLKSDVNSQIGSSFSRKLTYEQPSSTIPHDFKSQKTATTSFYGLPIRVKELLKDLRKITKLYDWQDEFLTQMLNRYERALKCLMQKQPRREDLLTNVLYLSPTSAGKTLVAELIILHCLLVRKKNCMFVMPFVSIVQEKVQSLTELADAMDSAFYIEEFAGVKGRVPPLKRRNKNTLYICTIEKAHSLVNSLIETDRLVSELGLVVADELHMIGDGPRGAIYEMILSKINYCSEKILIDNESKLMDKNLPIQIVATTATLENKNELAQFLNAEVFERAFRPVELNEYVKLDSQIYLVDKSKVHLRVNLEEMIKLDRELNTKLLTQELKRDDPDHLVQLVKEIVPEQSCLIFCSTKKNCENLASLLCSHLPPELKQYKRDLKLKLFNDLREENANNVCSILRQSLQFGIAYHHSGLTAEERLLIEQAYREGVLCLLTCTSTLAAGVNLPAKRVIIRSPYVGMEFMSIHQYKQMIGRAGRAGMIDSAGESILIFKNADRMRVLDLISGPMRRCESSFQGDDFKAIRLLVLSLIGLGLTHYGSQILLFFRQTLFFMQQKAKLISESTTTASEDQEDTKPKVRAPKEFQLISTALDYLLKKQLIKISSKDNLLNDHNEKETESLDYLYFCNFEVTKFGLGVIKGNVDLDYAEQLYADLKCGLKNMVLSNYLHLLFLCTPYDLVSSLMHVDFDIYARKYCNLTEDEIKCACVIGIKEDFIQKKRFQSKATSKKVDESVVKRFYLTLIIYELWKTNNSIWKVSSEFQLDRGFIQNITQSAASFTSGVRNFCEQMEDLWPYKSLLEEFTKRLQFNCSSIDLIPLLELDSVKLARAKQLFSAGYTSVEIVAAGKAEEMSERIKNLNLATAKRIIKSANKILKERIEVLQAEADNLIEQLHVDA